AEAVFGLAALLARAATNAGYTHNAWRMAAGFQAAANGTGDPLAWQDLAFDAPGSPGDALAQAPPRWRSRGIRVLLSDLFWLGDPLHTLRQLAERAALVLVIQVLAEADVNPPEEGSLRLIDSETGEVQEIYLDAAARQRYRDRLVAHQENWETACRQTGALFSLVVAERLLRDWAVPELVAAEVLQVI